VTISTHLKHAHTQKLVCFFCMAGEDLKDKV
jgi:hypothetical protein